MSPYNFSCYPDVQPDTEVQQFGQSWREVLDRHPAKQQEFDGLSPQAQDLVASRLDLQERICQAELDITEQKLIFDNLVSRKIQDNLVDVGQLEIARQKQSEAYKACLEVTAAVISVEAELCFQGLRSGPFLELLQNRHGQALDDGTATTLPSFEAAWHEDYKTLPTAG